MNIASVDYSLATRSVDIYLAGCHAPHCEGCHNPELWDFGNGKEFGSDVLQRVRGLTEEFDNLVDSIFIMGGEPLDQCNWNLTALLTCIKGRPETRYKNLVLFTRYSLLSIPSFIKDRCDYIKTGRYLPHLPTTTRADYLGIQLGSANQRIHKKGVSYCL